MQFFMNIINLYIPTNYILKTISIRMNVVISLILGSQENEYYVNGELVSWQGESNDSNELCLL